MRKNIFGVIAAIPAFLFINFTSSVSLADQPRPWQIGFQDSASPVMEKIADFHDMLLYVIFAISALVMILLIYVCIKFNEKRNPNPSKVAHNTFIEILWTVIPVVILLAIAIPSMRILFYTNEIKEADMTLKIVGYQWYWGYEYPDQGDINFLSNMVEDKDSKLRLLEVDNPVILPINKNIRIQLTAADVIHAWAVPALGVKTDAVPGRLNETWVRITKPGTYYGQCSELCGVNHGFMPIQIKAVSQEEFDVWVKAQG